MRLQLGCCILFILLSTLLSGCGGITPIWTQELKLTGDHTLYFAHTPREFQLEVPPAHDSAASVLRLELEITYQVNAVGRNDLPIELIIEKGGAPPMSYEVHVPLRTDGKWLGVPRRYDEDYALTYPVIPSFRLGPGSYSLKIYANDDQKEKIYGITRLVARLYELD